MKYGFLADAHGCSEAFARGMSVLRSVGAAEIFFLGDAVGYLCGMQVVDNIIDSGIPAIKGNHDHMLLSDSVSPEKDIVYRLRETRSVASRDQLSAMRHWPEYRRLRSSRGTILMIHGSPSDPVFGYVYPDTSLEAYDTDDAAAVFMANTHRPFVRHALGATFVNVGSCALPRDGGMLGAVCAYDTATGVAKILRYDIADIFERAMQEDEGVHESVRDLLNRPRPSDLVGEMVSCESHQE